MSENLIQLENILSEELRIFSNILRLEREKGEAIIKKDGSLIQKLSHEQEEYLIRIAPVENSRKKLTDQYSKDNPDSKITLKDIASMEGMPDSPLTQIGDLLKRTLDKIKSLQETNTKMINDNLEFFKKMVDELKGFSMETGYSEKGMENGKMVNSFLVDKKI